MDKCLRRKGGKKEGRREGERKEKREERERKKELKNIDILPLALSMLTNSLAAQKIIMGHETLLSPGPSLFFVCILPLSKSLSL